MTWFRYFILSLCCLLLISCSKKPDNKVNILVPIPLTGEAASYGKIIREGIEIGLQELADDPVRDKINIIYRDSKLSISEIVNIFHQETMRKSISVIMPASTGECMALAPLCNKNKIVLLPPLADGDELTKGNDYVFRVSPASSFQGKALADVVTKDGHKKTAIIYLQDAWGTGLNKAFGRTYTAGGGELSVSEGIQPGQKDFRTVLSHVENSGAEALVMFIHPAETGALLKQIREMNIKLALYGGDTFSNKTIYKEYADLAQGVVFTLPANPENDAYKNFSKRYKELFGTAADINAAASRDALLLIVNAIKQGCSSGEQIHSFFTSSKNYFSGAAGVIEWDSDHNVISKEYDVYVVSGKTYEKKK